MVEIELKFPVADQSALMERIAETALELQTPRTFERNTLFDTAGRELRAAGQLLRLRSYGELWTLTHKARPPAEVEAASRYKSRVETETRVVNGEAMESILAQLGFQAVFHYEKWRTEWRGEAGHLVLDETPIGTYAELEGEPEWIDRMVELLGVDPSLCLTESYGRLFLAWKQSTGSPAMNLTFAEC